MESEVISQMGNRNFHYDFMRPHKIPQTSINLLEAGFECGANKFSEFAKKEFCVDLSFSSAVGTELTVRDYKRCIEEKVFLIPYSIKINNTYLQFFITLPPDLLSLFFSTANVMFSDDKWLGKKLPEIIEILLRKFGSYLIDGIEKKCKLTEACDKKESGFELGPINYIRRKDIVVIEKEDSDNMGLLITLRADSENIENYFDIFIPYEFYNSYFSNLDAFKKDAAPFVCKRQHGNGYVSLGWCNIDDENRQLLKKGAVITFEQFVDEPLPLVLRQNNLMFAEGEVTMVNENYAVHISKLHANPKDVNVVKHYVDYGLNVLPGNVYACLGEFQIHDENEVKIGDCIDLNRKTFEFIDLVEKDSGKVLARGELFANGFHFAVKVMEIF